MFRAGDEVICIDDVPRGGGSFLKDSPVKGCVYKVVVVSSLFGKPMLHLSEIKNLYAGQDGYAANRFRKVQRRDISQWLENATNFEEPKRKKANA